MSTVNLGAAQAVATADFVKETYWDLEGSGVVRYEVGEAGILWANDRQALCEVTVKAHTKDNKTFWMKFRLSNKRRLTDVRRLWRVINHGNLKSIG